MPSLRSFIGSRPGLFFPMYRLTHRGERERALLFDDDTQLVLEGFPRSGNTFAVLAFRNAQPRRVPMAHHLHHPAQVLRGVHRGVPTVVLIREPRAAIRSLALRRPEVPVSVLIAQYLDFYRALHPVRGRYYLADFEQVTTDFGAVTRRINERFGTSFACFEHTPENVARIFAEIDRINAALGGDEQHVSRPSAARARVSQATMTRQEAERMSRADDLYRTLTKAPASV